MIRQLLRKEVPAVGMSEESPLETENETAPEEVAPEQVIVNEEVAPDAQETKPVVTETSDYGLTEEERSDIQSADDIINDGVEQTDEEVNEEVNEKLKDALTEDSTVDEAMEEEDSSIFYEIDELISGAHDTDAPGEKYDKLSHTLFFSNTEAALVGEAMISVVKPNIPDAKKFLMDPNALDKYNVSIIVGQISDKDWNYYRPGEVHSKFNNADKSTWDNAVITVIITDKKGKPHLFTVGFPNTAENSLINRPDGTSVRKFSNEEIELLRKFRANVIEQENIRIDAAKNGRRLILSPSRGISRGRSKISLLRDNKGNAVQRGLHKIGGFIDGFKGDFSTIGRNNLTLAYGKGGRGGNVVVGPDMNYGSTYEQNSGAIFALKKDPISGETRKVKINKRRFGDDNGVAELIYRLVVEQGASPVTQLTLNKKGEVVVAQPGQVSVLGISVGRLLANIVNFGESTFVAPEDRGMFAHLIPKQFFLAAGGKLVYGENTMDISNPAAVHPEDKVKLIEYIKSNFTWTVNKKYIMGR